MHSGHGDVFAVGASEVPAGLTLSAVCADDVGAHVFRHQVAAHLLPSWSVRAKALRSCGESGARLVCAECETVHVTPFRCAARSCPTCAHIASAVAVDRVAAKAEDAFKRRGVAEQWDGDGKREPKTWKLFTATMQTPGDYGSPERFQTATLKQRLRLVRGAWGPFWRALPWGKKIAVARDKVDTDTGEVIGTRRSLIARRDTMFAMGLEVAPGGMVHLHAAVYAEFLPWQVLRAEWRRALGVEGNIKVKQMRADSADDFRAALREVLKYVSKGDKSPRRAEWAANIECAMFRVRRVEVGGALRAKVDVGAREVTYAGAKACDNCGTRERWKWAGLRASEYVVRNGGFGRDHLATTARRLREASILNEETRDNLAQYYAGDDVIFPAVPVGVE